MTPRERANALIKPGTVTRRGRECELMVINAVCFPSCEDSLRHVQEQVAGVIREAVSEERRQCALLVTAAYAALHDLESSHNLQVHDGETPFGPFVLDHMKSIERLKQALAPFPQPCRCGAELVTEEQRIVGQCPACEEGAAHESPGD